MLSLYLENLGSPSILRNRNYVKKDRKFKCVLTIGVDVEQVIFKGATSSD